MNKFLLLGKHVSCSNLHRKEDGILEWVRNQRRDWLDSRLLSKKRFEGLSHRLFQKTLQEVKDAQIPNFGDFEYDDSK